jgi:hypothetical protein
MEGWLDLKASLDVVVKTKKKKKRKEKKRKKISNPLPTPVGNQTLIISGSNIIS